MTRHAAPLRLAPLHIIFDAGLSNGDIVPRPGEVSLCYNNLYFFDELFDFPRNDLDLMRQSLEEHGVTIASSSMSLDFPARFIRAAMQSREWTAQGVTRLQDSFSFDLRRKIRYFLRFQEAAFFIFKITDQTVLSCYVLDRFQIRVPSRWSKARSRRRTNETHHAKRANVFRNPSEGIRLGPRHWPGLRSSQG